MPGPAGAYEHLANKPQQTTSTLFGLMYPMTAQRTINIFTMDESVGVTLEHVLIIYFCTSTWVNVLTPIFEQSCEFENLQEI